MQFVLRSLEAFCALGLPQRASRIRATHLLRFKRVPLAPTASMKCCTLLLAGLLAGCVYVPRTTSVYDEGCKIYARQMTLEVEQVGAYARCANEGCVALLVGAGAVTAASAVVSGSIVVAGNIVYWFEKRGQCASR